MIPGVLLPDNSCVRRTIVADVAKGYAHVVVKIMIRNSVGVPHINSNTEIVELAMIYALKRPVAVARHAISLFLLEDICNDRAFHADAGNTLCPGASVTQEK